MKLATLKTGGRDGSLIVVSRNLEHYVPATDIASTLQLALDDWHQAAPRLKRLVSWQRYTGLFTVFGSNLWVPTSPDVA